MLKRRFLLVILPTLLLTYCMPFLGGHSSDTVQTTFVLNSRYEKTWDAFIDALLDLKYQIGFTDKESGIISTKTKELQGSEAGKWAHNKHNLFIWGYDSYRQRITIRLKPMDDGRVKANIVVDYDALKTDSDGKTKTIPLVTNGRFEQELVTRVLKKLKEQS